jgi:hypothetical protein
LHWFRQADRQLKINGTKLKIKGTEESLSSRIYERDLGIWLDENRYVVVPMRELSKELGRKQPTLGSRRVFSDGQAAAKAFADDFKNWVNGPDRGSITRFSKQYKASEDTIVEITYEWTDPVREPDDIQSASGQEPVGDSQASQNASGQGSVMSGPDRMRIQSLCNPE